MPAQKTLIVIAGPTAIGKTQLAISLAQYFNTDILSADSRQFYREMNIGTAKPSQNELDLAKHYFINSLSITDSFTAGDFEKQGLAILNLIFTKADTAILVGGSGLFINAICKGFDELPAAAPGIRNKLNTLYQEEGIEALQIELQAADPDYFAEVDKSNPQRIIRALEVWYTSGRPISSYRKSQANQRPFNIIRIALNTTREILYERINQRVDLMIRAGLVEEVKNLIPYKHLNALHTVGYTELFDYFDNQISFNDAVERIKQNTRRYAKRQLTWLRKELENQWFKPDQYNEIIAYIRKKISA